MCASLFIPPRTVSLIATAYTWHHGREHIYCTLSGSNPLLGMFVEARAEWVAGFIRTLPALVLSCFLCILTVGIRTPTHFGRTPKSLPALDARPRRPPLAAANSNLPDDFRATRTSFTCHTNATRHILVLRTPLPFPGRSSYMGVLRSDTLPSVPPVCTNENDDWIIILYAKRKRKSTMIKSMCRCE